MLTFPSLLASFACLSYLRTVCVTDIVDFELEGAESDVKYVIEESECAEIEVVQDNGFVMTDSVQIEVNEESGDIDAEGHLLGHSKLGQGQLILLHVSSSISKHLILFSWHSVKCFLIFRQFTDWTLI